MIKNMIFFAKFEWRMSWRSLTEVTTLLALYFLGVLLSVLILGEEGFRLNSILVFWIIMLFVQSIGIDKLFSQDIQYGHLDLWLLSSSSMHIIIFIKLFMRWLGTGLLMTICSLLFNIGLDLQHSYIPILALGIGSIGITFLGGALSGLTSASKQSNLILPVVIFPFLVPILIFGSAVSIDTQALGILSGLVAIYVLITPMLASIGLKAANN